MLCSPAEICAEIKVDEPRAGFRLGCNLGKLGRQTYGGQSFVPFVQVFSDAVQDEVSIRPGV
jgi:hypothetical protein